MTSPRAPESTIPGALERSAASHAGQAALIMSDRVVTFDELEALARQAAAAMVGLGVEVGDRVGLWARNSLDWAVASLAVLVAGGSVVPINARYTRHEASDLLGRAHCRLILADGLDAGRDLADEASGFASPVPVVSFGSTGAPGVAPWSDFAASGGPAATVEIDRRLAALSPDSVSHVQYTSGTTGVPKGAMLCHQAMVETTREWAGVVGLTAGDRYPVVSPFSHISGHKTGLLACVVTGAAALPLASLAMDDFAQLVEDQDVTVVQGPPTLFHSLIERARADGGVFASLRVGVTGAAVIPPTLVRDMYDVLHLDRVVTAYGLTEATGVCTMTRAGDPVEVVAETSGRSIPGVAVQVVDGSGENLPSGEIGEIEVRGVGVMLGYLDDAEATAAAVHDGWLATGDLGWIGDDGNLRIVDRLKDMVVVGGFNVYPAEIEKVLLRHPAVSQAAVVGLPDERMGEVPAAFVVPQPGIEPAASEVELVEHCREHLAKFKVPRSLWLIASLPLNAVGKVDKPELRMEAQRRSTP
jgi:acyl-CoA synthetase (AMP-forming)/AMP-acid ligase II